MQWIFLSSFLTPLLALFLERFLAVLVFVKFVHRQVEQDRLFEPARQRAVHGRRDREQNTRAIQVRLCSKDSRSISPFLPKLASFGTARTDLVLGPLVTRLWIIAVTH